MGFPVALSPITVYPERAKLASFPSEGPVTFRSMLHEHRPQVPRLDSHLGKIRAEPLKAVNKVNF